MTSKKEKYELILNDLTIGQVEGLEEKYHEIKFRKKNFNVDDLEDIINEVGNNYKLSFKGLLSAFNIGNIE